MERVTRRNLLGLRVQDCYGEEIGQIVNTWPEDGGWEIEMVVVRLARFGERRMLPAGAVTVWGSVLVVPYTRMQVEDAPVTGEGVHRADDPYRALAYWRWEESAPTDVDIVTPRWRRSSGFFVMERPSPTTPSPTPTAS